MKKNISRINIKTNALRKALLSWFAGSISSHSNQLLNRVTEKEFPCFTYGVFFVVNQKIVSMV
jgi:hypothetical protein